MILNRLFLILLILLSGVFASFYGGRIAYAFFYLTLLLPLFCIIYICFVIIRVKLDQTIDKKSVIKGETVNYRLEVFNYDIISFYHIKLVFFKNKLTIKDENIEFSLLPESSKVYETEMVCNKRGEYFIGVNKLLVTDFLNLFSIKYYINRKISIQVMPRIIQLQNINLLLNEEMKISNNTNRFNDEEILDIDIRKYESGDNKKLIHWKASAKRMELQSRVYRYYEKMGIKVYMDLRKINVKNELVQDIEDQVIEIAIAIVNYCLKNRMPTEICYDEVNYINLPVNSYVDFDIFYKICATIKFGSKRLLENLLDEIITYDTNKKTNILVLHDISDNVIKKLLYLVENDFSIWIILIQQENSDTTNEKIIKIRNLGINITLVLPNDDLQEILLQS